MFSRTIRILAAMSLAGFCMVTFAQSSDPITDTVNSDSLTLPGDDRVQEPNSSDSSVGNNPRLESTLPPMDSDGDGVPDLIDNCTLVYNPDQQDTNNDGFGNICDQDINGDCNVDFIDYSILIHTGVIFSNPDVPGWNPDFDFNSNGVLNFIDYGRFVIPGTLFNPPGPSATECIVGE